MDEKKCIKFWKLQTCFRKSHHPTTYVSKLKKGGGLICHDVQIKFLILLKLILFVFLRKYLEAIIKTEQCPNAKICLFMEKLKLCDIFNYYYAKLLGRI